MSGSLLWQSISGTLRHGRVTTREPFVVGDRVRLAAGTLNREGTITRLSALYADVRWSDTSFCTGCDTWKCHILNLEKIS